MALTSCCLSVVGLAFSLELESQRNRGSFLFLLFFLFCRKSCVVAFRGVLARTSGERRYFWTVRLVYSRFQVVLVLLIMFTLLYAFYAL